MSGQKHKKIHLLCINGVSYKHYIETLIYLHIKCGLQNNNIQSRIKTFEGTYSAIVCPIP